MPSPRAGKVDAPKAQTDEEQKRHSVLQRESASPANAERDVPLIRPSGTFPARGEGIHPSQIDLDAEDSVFDSVLKEAAKTIAKVEPDCRIIM